MPIGGRKKLVWRLYFVGFLQLVVLGTVVASVASLLRPARPTLHAGPPPGLPEGPPPDGPPPDGPPGHPPGLTSPPRGPTPWVPLVTFLVGGLVIVGAGSFLTARWIVGPLRTLARTARADTC